MTVVICLKIRTFVVSATTVKQRFEFKLGCDLLENSYLCGISNNGWRCANLIVWVVICLKIRTFVVSATTYPWHGASYLRLWFAWKFVPLWYQQQRSTCSVRSCTCCDLLENSYLCGISNNVECGEYVTNRLWFAWKFVPLWYQQQLCNCSPLIAACCDLLENSYLCGISNNRIHAVLSIARVVICLKIRTFVVSATTKFIVFSND